MTAHPKPRKLLRALQPGQFVFTRDKKVLEVDAKRRLQPRLDLHVGKPGPWKHLFFSPGKS